MNLHLRVPPQDKSYSSCEGVSQSYHEGNKGASAQEKKHLGAKRRGKLATGLGIIKSLTDSKSLPLHMSYL